MSLLHLKNCLDSVTAEYDNSFFILAVIDPEVFHNCRIILRNINYNNLQKTYLQGKQLAV